MTVEKPDIFCCLKYYMKMKIELRQSVLIILTVFLFAAFAGCDSDKKIRLKNLKNDTTGTLVHSINFTGNKTLKAKELKKKLNFKIGDRFDSVLIDTGRNDLSEYYRKQGFPEVKISIDASGFPQGKIKYNIDEGPRFIIKSIRFTGNKAIKTGDLKTVIKTRTKDWFFWPSYYTKEKIDADIKRLEKAYYNRGFLNYEIHALGRSNITFLIEEGPQYKVGNIVVTGNTKYDNETLLSKFELKTGGVYYPLKANEQAKHMLKIYRENGYVDARIITEPNFVKGKTDVVDADFKIIEGRQYRIGQIEVTGNDQTQDKVVRRTLDEWDFSPGKLYNADIAPAQGGGELEKRVQRSTLAEEVTISPAAPANDQNDQLDALVNMKEGLTGMWNPGVAYGSDNGLYGQLLWSQRNFDITDWPESFGEFITMQSFKGAGQTLSVDLRPGVEVSYYSISFTEPYMFNKPTSMTVTGSSWERWLESHDERRTKGTVGFQKRYRSLWRTNLGFRAENVNVREIEDYAPKEIKDYRGDNLLLGIKVGFGRDETDDAYLPTKGYVFNIDYEQVTGVEDFGKLEGSGVIYKTIYEDFQNRKTVLASKILAGTTFSDAPFFEKYYAGGIGYYGLRGFKFRGVSTRGLQTEVFNPRRIDPIGSDWIFLANTELAIPLIGENISWLFFADSGIIDTGPYRVSVGTGIQILVPQFFGPVPLRFTLADPLRKSDEDDTQSFNFFMGGMF